MGARPFLRGVSGRGAREEKVCRLLQQSMYLHALGIIIYLHIHLQRKYMQETESSRSQ